MAALQHLQSSEHAYGEGISLRAAPARRILPDPALAGDGKGDCHLKMNLRGIQIFLLIFEDRSKLSHSERRCV